MARYVENRTRSLETDDLVKLKQARKDQEFDVYVDNLVGWLKEKQQRVEKVVKEQANLVDSLGLSAEQIKELNSQISGMVQQKMEQSVGAADRDLAIEAL